MTTFFVIESSFRFIQLKLFLSDQIDVKVITEQQSTVHSISNRQQISQNTKEESKIVKRNDFNCNENIWCQLMMLHHTNFFFYVINA